jgi:hypothetical protein
MKAYFIFSGLFAVSTIFGVSSDENSLFEKYLSACEYNATSFFGHGFGV